MLVLVACGRVASSEGGDASTSTAADTSASLDTTSTPIPTTTAGDGADTSSSGPAITGTSEDTAAPCANLPLGSPCEDPECDCESDQCFVVEPLGGVCSECDEDADCEPEPGFGCNFGNPLTHTPAVCSGGERPQGCEIDGDCPMGQYCLTVIEVPGILSVTTCSDCKGDIGCMAGELCVPTVDIANAGGYYSCVDPGSVPDESGCNVDGDGTECASGQCAPAALMGVPIVAVCSPCNEDGDCGGGMTCQLPEVAIEGDALVLVPGACV